MKVGDLGLIGLGVMGANLALNFERNGYVVAVYNRKEGEEQDVVSRFMKENGKNKNFIPAATIGELVDKVSRPRKIVLMVTAGDPVDELVDQLLPHLSLGDIVIDGEIPISEIRTEGFVLWKVGVSGLSDAVFQEELKEL